MNLADNRVLRSSLTLLASALITAGLYAAASADEGQDWLLLRGSGAAADAATQQPGESTTDFNQRWYLGFGAGLSRIRPESQTRVLGVVENKDSGMHVLLGYDLNRWLSTEVYFADLGAADVEFMGAPVGDIGYQVFGIRGIGYFFNAESGFGIGNNATGHARREGLSLFGRIGLGGISNDTDLDYERDHPVHLSVGVGLEYGFRNGFALRAAMDGFDTDARYLSATVLKRFGEPAPLAPVAVPVAAVVAPPQAPVDDTPFFAQAIVPPYVYFDFDSHTLTDKARSKLDAFAEAIEPYDWQLLLGGHTDWVGTERYNVGLSVRRANAVRDYLVSKGIDADRLQAIGYGESRPIENNTSARGRAYNRRTELRIR